MSMSEISLSESVNFQALENNRRSEISRLSAKVWDEVAAKSGRFASKPVSVSEPSLLETLRASGFVRLVDGQGKVKGVRILKK